MPIDPTIILQGMANMPDVNALLQQQISGMENINALERQRRGDELVMQDRATAAEKEAAQAQEAAAIKALLPAYTYGIQTGDMAGAGNLVPPEMRPQLQPYIDALDGKSPQEVQAALIGSLSSSPAGQEALAAIQRAQNFGVQQGQLKVSQERLAFDKEKAAAEAASGDKVVQWITDDAGNVRGLNAQGKVVVTQPGIGKKSASAITTDGLDAKTQAKFEQAYPKAASSLRTAVTGMDNTLVALENLINDPGLKLISGTVGAYTPNINADAKRAQALFDQIKAGAGLAALVELKQASPSGGALGNVSNQEGNTLRDSRGAFLQAQEYEDLKQALIDYYGVLQRSKANITAAFDDTYSYRGENQAESILQSAQEQFQDIEQQTQQKFTPPTGPTIRRVK